MKNKYLSARVGRVSRLCPVFRAQPGGVPTGSPKTGAAPPCGTKIRPKPSAAGSTERGNAATVGNTETGKIRRFWTLRRESRRKA